MNIVIYSIIAIGYFVGFYFLFPKADRKSWEALVPGYNFFVLTRIIQKPWWWILFLILPGVNILMLMVMNSNLASVFGKLDKQSQVFAIFLPFIAFPLWGKQDKLPYVGPIDRKKYPKSWAREWGDAIVFAVVAASIIRTYFLEAFTIPTSSMEKSLLIGDYLFVSKMAYGPKVPQTPLSFPFAHHSLPFTETPSYLDWMNLDYYRLPGFGEVERNDIVVFNYPEGDTVLLAYQSNRSYNQVVRDYMNELRKRDIQMGQPPKSFEQYNKDARRLLKDNMEYTVRPVDKREHYIKRCVAIPGDKILVKDAQLYINDEMAFIPPESQFKYVVEKNGFLNKRILKDRFDVNYQDSDARVAETQKGFRIPLTLDAATELESLDGVKSVTLDVTSKSNDPIYSIFPNSPEYDWSVDYWGPLTVPGKGETVALNLLNLPFYERIISVYEGHDLKVKDGEILIDGSVADAYTFAMDYYFMMGDNRHNSADSRYWGFVPEDHIVGKAAFIWLSMDPELDLFDGRIRFSRMFSIPE